MVGVRDLPQFGGWGAGVNALRVAQWNVVIDLAVNQKRRNRCIGGGVLWRNFFHVEVILQARAKECDFHERAE